MALTTLVALVAFRKEPDIFRGPGDETDETFDCIRAFPPFLAMMSHEQTWPAAASIVWQISMLVITALFAGHHHHRPSRDQLASAASTTSVVRKLLPLYQQELLLASSSSIAANQVMNSATHKSAARSIVVEVFFFFFFLQIKMHLCSNQKLRIDLVQSYIYIYNQSWIWTVANVFLSSFIPNQCSCSWIDHWPRCYVCLLVQVSTCETTNSLDQGSEQLQQQHKQQVVSTTRHDRHHRSSHKLLLENLSSSSSRTRQKDSSLLKYRLPPRRSVTVFETDRLVPTGPNPFHNSNSTQVWYPWAWKKQQSQQQH